MKAGKKAAGIPAVIRKHIIFAIMLIGLAGMMCACVRAENSTVAENTQTEAGSGENPEDKQVEPLVDITANDQRSDNTSDNTQGTENSQKNGNNTEAGGTPGTDNSQNSGSNPENGNTTDTGNASDPQNQSASGDNTSGTGEAADTGNANNAGNSGDEGNTSTGENTSGSGASTKHVVVLDPGHGGKRGGAWYLGIAEKDITLKVANYARDYLLENYKNIEVYLTRETDEALDPDNKIELEMRCDLAREVGADCLVSIHFNATDAHIQHGAEIWISRNTQIHDQTLALGESIMAELEALGIRRNSIASRKSTDMFDENGRAIDYYAINRHCAARGIPGIIVEQCYMDNEIDQVHITTEEGLKQLGEANARGIANYLELEAK